MRELKAQVASLRGMGVAAAAAAALALSCASPMPAAAAETGVPERLAHHQRLHLLRPQGGMAVFTGHVRVDDGQCQMHADKAYVFLSYTNSSSASSPSETWR